MITEELYEKYIGVGSAPTNFERLSFLALEEIKSVITDDIPLNEEDDTIYSDEFLKAWYEEIKYLDDNKDLIEGGNSGASLGKYNEGTGNKSKVNDNRISPTTYKILLNLGLLYPGIEVC